MDIFIAALPAALALIMFSLGLGLGIEEFRRVLREPKAFGVGVLSQLVLLPLVAFVLVTAFALPPELAFGLMILSFCPGGVTSNVLTRIARGDLALSISLTGVISLVSVLTLPILVAVAAGHFLGREAPPIDVTMLGILMFAMTAVPVAIGMSVRRFAPRVSAALDSPLSTLSLVLFVVIVAGAIIGNWTLLSENFAALAPSLVALNVLLLAIGFALSRLFSLSRSQASAIAIETGIQNSTLGITIGSLIAEQASGLPAFSLPSGVYGVTMYLVSVPFVLWCRHRRGSSARLQPAE